MHACLLLLSAACGALTPGGTTYVRSSGEIDTTFASGNGFNGAVDKVLLQSDGKLIVGGRFSSYESTSAPYLVRLKSDASLDSSFQSALASAPNDSVFALALGSSDAIIVGGAFTSLGGLTRNGIAMLDAGGNVDESFMESLAIRGFAKGVSSATLGAVAVDTNGRILAGGDFLSYGGQTAQKLSRLSREGQLDATFQANVDTGFDLTLSALLPQSDGTTVVGGSFTSYRNDHVGGIAKVNEDGSPNPTFMVNVGAGTSNGGFNDAVSAVAQESDGSFIVGGDFSLFRGSSEAPGLARLSNAGVFDEDFATALGTGFENGGVKSIVIDPDGNIIVGGSFTSFNGKVANGLIRLSRAGEMDPDFASHFTSSIGGSILTMALQSDGKLIVAGHFSTIAGSAAGNIARLK